MMTFASPTLLTEDGTIEVHTVFWIHRLRDGQVETVPGPLLLWLRGLRRR